MCSSSSTVINLSRLTPYLAVFAMNVCSRDAAKTLGGGVKLPDFFIYVPFYNYTTSIRVFQGYASPRKNGIF